MEIAIDWSENSKGELVGKVLNPEANVQKLVDEVKNAPVDFPSKTLWQRQIFVCRRSLL